MIEGQKNEWKRKKKRVCVGERDEGSKKKMRQR